MKRISEYLALTVLVCILLLPSCRRVRIISQRDMSDIYAEMFLADQWLNDNPKFKTTADTRASMKPYSANMVMVSKTTMPA